ncbi:MAG TPA: cupin domain-containing protein [Capsulimonadaceae bacterium]|jgi:quercetin dioxygenase-like cupin family protein
MATPKETIKLGAIEIRFLLDGDDTGGELCMFEFLVLPGARVPAPHYHELVDEAAYGLEGELTFTVGGEVNVLSPGERCFVPRGVVHHFANHGQSTARVLSVLTPALIGPAYFRELADLVSAGPPDPAAVAAVMKRHGLVVVPPSV